LKWGLPSSLILHVLLWLALLPEARRLPAPFDEGVPVEVWSPEQFEQVTAQGGPPSVDPAASPAASPSEKGASADLPPSSLPMPPPAVGTVVRASRILSGDVLSDPLSRKARAMLSHLETEMRLEQLCGIEAMAQIAEWHRQFQPDRVVAYAMADVKVSGTTIVADGAAFRSRQHWYKLKFSCDTVPGRDEVRALEFAVGEPIPRRAWERYGLPPVH
jgi:hypothetical protein